MLVAGGHEVVGTARSQEGQDWMLSVGAEPVTLDALDRKAVLEVVGRLQPQVVVHQATALSVMSGNPKKLGEEFAETNRLRIEGTDNLLEAARVAGARRVVAVRDPLDPQPPEACEPSSTASGTSRRP